MTRFVYKNAKFIKTAVAPSGYPVLKNLQGKEMPEIAVAGRSNVGKSSLLNDLFQSKGLVKTSATPGKTQALNFFTLNDQLAFVDLPGYGYAQVPHAVRKKWGPMVHSYLQNRTPLKLLLLLIDIRRVPNEDDRQLIEWIVHQQKAMIVVITKVDKVKQNEKRANTRKILEALGVENVHYVYYSVTEHIGRKELIAMLNDALKDEEEDEEENGADG